MRNNEWQQPGKTLIIILGACGSGKSTLTRAICGEGGIEHTEDFVCYDRRTQAYVRERAKYIVGSSGIAIAGNWKNTSDAISRAETLNNVVDLCFEVAATVIVDSFRLGRKFVDWVQQHPFTTLHVVFVYLDVTLEANLARMLGRRRANGKVETQLPEKTYATLLQTRDGARKVWEYAQQNYVREPRTFVRIADHLTPEESADLIREETELWKPFSRPAA